MFLYICLVLQIFLFLSCGDPGTGGLQLYLSPGEIAARASFLDGKRVKVYGRIRAGSLMHRPGAMEYAFLLEHGQDVVNVEYRGFLSPNVQEGREVAVEGVWSRNQGVKARRVLTRCPSKYKAKLGSEGSDVNHGAPPDPPLH